MDAAHNLIELILRLLKDPAALAEFQENPDAVLAACGASDVSAEDVHDALVLADDGDYDDVFVLAPHPGQRASMVRLKYGQRSS